MKELIQVQAILYKSNGRDYKFLVLKRVPGKKGFWQPVTGGKKEGESIEDALKREVFEETGLGEKETIKITKIYSFNWQTQYREDPKERVNFTEYAFGVEVQSKFEVKIGKEHEEYRWCSYDDAISLIGYETNKESLRRLNARLK